MRRERDGSRWLCWRGRGKGDEDIFEALKIDRKDVSLVLSILVAKIWRRANKKTSLFHQARIIKIISACNQIYKSF